MTFSSRRTARHSFILTAATGFVAMSATITTALASPVQVFECTMLSSVGPLPFEYVDTRYTIRRHIVPTSLVDELSTDFWSQGTFSDNGEFEVTVYPFGAEPRTETSTSVESIILDGLGGAVGDRYLDQALSMNKTISYEGYTLDSVNILFERQDGQAITSHTSVPVELVRENWDPYGCGFGGCDRECVVTWRAPGDGVPCAVGGSGGGAGLCPTGSYIGRIDSISFEEHEADHGGAFVINAGLNDAWVTAQAPFQGLFITVYPQLGLVFVAWFTFEVPGVQAATSPQSVQQAMPAVFGGEQQRWVTAVGPYTGNRAELNMELTSGGLFNSSVPTPQQDTDYGTMVLEFDGCENGTVTFDVPSADLAGTFAISRVVNDNAALCAALNDL